MLPMLDVCDLNQEEGRPDRLALDDPLHGVLQVTCSEELVEV
jgi:hypothetical protein